MCGICGIIDLKQGQNAEWRLQTVAKMNAALVHRGPDGVGNYNPPGASLAMRRLAIIDTVGGDQPIFNEDQTIGVFFNGEIYNFLELRQSLEEKGHHFRTQSDTEVLVHLYEECGVEFVSQLRGMFAFCLFDLPRQRFVLSRDRFGEKPLYYHYGSGAFSFSSEIGSLLKNPKIKRRLNHEALPYYFRTSLVPEPITLLADVMSLPPGHSLLIKGGEVEEMVYYDPSTALTEPIQREEEAIEFIRPHLIKAVERQMISDVPLAAFLSGGIDSSSVVALMQNLSQAPITTFNVRFEDQTYDESHIAKQVAEHCGTNHCEVFVPNLDFDEELFWMIIDHVGLPFRDSSAIPSFLVTRAISKDFKVAVSGDGGDEVFGGYDLFQWYLRILELKGTPPAVRRLAKAGLRFASQMPGLKRLSKIRQINRAISTSLLPESEIPIALNEMYAPLAMERLLNKGRSLGGPYPILENYPATAQDWTSLRKIMYYRLHHTLPANMLIKVDRMSMANSLEVRAPFLDPDLFSAAARLPDDLLIKNGKGKYLLRQIMREYLPNVVFDHPKQGFNLPLFRYRNAAFGRLARRLLFTENPWLEQFDRTELEAIYQRGMTYTQDDATTSVFQTAHQLWMLMQLFGWAKKFGVQW
ncbi:MAG: asparagine synthase (glutamine-hydrolyzing) [Bacteroidota bacterium]